MSGNSITNPQPKNYPLGPDMVIHDSTANEKDERRLGNLRTGLGIRLKK